MYIMHEFYHIWMGERGGNQKGVCYGGPQKPVLAPQGPLIFGASYTPAISPQLLRSIQEVMQIQMWNINGKSSGKQRGNEQ